MNSRIRSATLTVLLTDLDETTVPKLEAKIRDALAAVGFTAGVTVNEIVAEATDG